MITQETVGHTLRSKTGWIRVEGNDVGWWVGYLESKENVYFFYYPDNETALSFRPWLWRVL